ncbi:MAG: MFS transporter [Thermoplasmataceae archaeon]|jgi:MFS family permease
MGKFSVRRGLGPLVNTYVRVVSITQLIRTLGRSVVWIFVPIYLSEVRGVPFFDVGLIFFATAMLSLPFSLYGGNLIDKVGRRFAAIITPPMMAVILLIEGIVVARNLSIIILIATFLLFEPIASIQGIVDNVIITEETPESQRNDAFSIIRIAANIGFSFGPAIGGFLSYINFSLVFFIPMFITIIEWFIFVKYIRNRKQFTVSQERRLTEFPTGDRLFLIISLIIASSFFVAGQWGTTLTLFWSSVDHITNREIGLLYTVNGIIVVLFQVPINWLFVKVRDHIRIAAGVMIYSISFFLLIFSNNFLFLVSDVILITMAENIISPVIYTVIGKMAPEGKKGQYFGAFQLIVSFIQPIAPVMGTFLLGRFQGEDLFMWTPILVIGIVVTILTLKFGAVKPVKAVAEETPL